jgi:signal transduction histidine kinase
MDISDYKDTGLRHWLKVTEPHVLPLGFSILILIIIWTSTFSIIEVEQINAERAASTSTLELIETYEAQAIRVFREIDQTLKLVKYTYELNKDLTSLLQDLKKKSLLPPDLLFSISIADSQGNIVASNRPFKMHNISRKDYFQVQRDADLFSIGHTEENESSNEWKINFSRRLNDADGTFAGIVVVEADAAYFVSVYETSRLGKNGVLAILGTDGVFRARRSGESVTYGAQIDYASIVPDVEQENTSVTLSVNLWDGVLRYTSARQLYGFPVAVVIGLSRDEQLAAARQHRRVYLLWATIGSIVLILVAGTLSFMSRQLAKSRARTLKAQAIYQAAAEANVELEKRIAEREAELVQIYASRSEYEKSVAVTAERQRIIRDIHDDLGSQLMSSIPLAEQGNLSPGEIGELLRECIDALRLGIDSLKPLGDDLNAVLGNFRYRFQGRLAAAGLKLEWLVNELPMVPTITAEVVLQIMRIVQEAVTNVIKHANASSVCITASFDDSISAIQLRISDNGTGFDTTSTRNGEGLSSMAVRAKRINAKFDLTSSVDGTYIHITLPIE